MPTLRAQSINLDSLEQKFSIFNKVPEENIYVHLNKTIFLNEEDIGFTSYIINEKNQRPLLETKNVYAQLIDEKQTVIKEQMLLAENGVATGILSIDSLVPAGNYNLKVFTNWMRNFDKPNYGKAELSIVATRDGLKSLETTVRNFDVQFFPESGNAIDKVITRVGVLVKDQYGKGTPAQVMIYKDGEKLNDFQLDKNGVGSFMWLPEQGVNWVAEVLIDKQTNRYDLPLIKSDGIHLTTSVNKETLGVGLVTNQKTFEDYAFDDFYFLINGIGKLVQSKVELIELKRSFNVPLDSLQPGVNQITLVHEDGGVVGNRVFFNHKNYKYIDDAVITATSDLDSLITDLRIDVDSAVVSVSVLPVKTMVTTTNRSIIHKFRFFPYVRGKIERLENYFPINDLKSVQAFDQVLLCQGWEVYDWENVQNIRQQKFKYDFEEGISITGVSNDSKFKEVLLYGNEGSGTTILPIDEKTRSFSARGYFPVGNERFRVGGLDKKSRTKKISLYPKFTPNQIPDFPKTEFDKLTIDEEVNDFEIQGFTNLDGVLDEIVVKADPNEKRNQRIENLARGRVDFFDDNDRRNIVNLQQYLGRNGFIVNQNQGLLDITYQFGQRFQDPRPAFEIDGVIYDSPEVLIGFDMSIVDYVEFDLSGRGRAFGRQNIPVVKIVTDPGLSPFKRSSKVMSAYNVPLTFSEPIDFYRPRYYSYSSPMFEKLGVIDWHGKLNVVDGEVNFTMPFLGLTEMKMIIEGMTPDGKLIHIIKDVTIN